MCLGAVDLDFDSQGHLKVTKPFFAGDIFCVTKLSIRCALTFLNLKRAAKERKVKFQGEETRVIEDTSSPSSDEAKEPVFLGSGGDTSSDEEKMDVPQEATNTGRRAMAH